MDKKNNPTVLIDTNLLISAVIIKGSTPSALLQAWKENKFTLLMSEEILFEIEAVLKRKKIYKKYNLSLEEIHELIETLRISTTFAIPLPLTDLPIHSRDIKDDKLLTCALATNCDYLVTGDQDLLVLNGTSSLNNLKIITASVFLSLL